MVTNTAGALATPPSRFFTLLPREIRDQIYSLAYPSDDPHEMTSLERAEYWERQIIELYCLHGGGGTSALLREPRCPLKPMTVCGQWYREAVEEWFRNRTIRCEDYSDFLHITSRLPSIAVWKQSLCRLEVRLRIEYFPKFEFEYERDILLSRDVKVQFRPIPELPKLRKLVILIPIGIELCSPEMNKDPRGLALRPSDFETIPGIWAFVRSIAHVQILELRSDYRQLCFTRNVEALERWLQEKLSAVRKQIE